MPHTRLLAAEEINGTIGGRMELSKITTPRSRPLRFVTTFHDADRITRTTVVRIVHAFSDPGLTDRNRRAKAVLANVLKSWPPGLRTPYLITAGGFLSFKWPRKVTVADPSKPDPKDIQLLTEAAEKACRDFLTPTLRRRLAKVADYITLGADSERKADDDGKRRTAEFVLLFDLHSSRVWITGKSYPGVQERLLVRMNDLSRNFVRISGDRVLLLGCHDLNMFSNRAFRNCDKDGWRAKRMKQIRKMTLRFRPNVVLQHPHRTQSPHAWGTALGGLKHLLHEDGVSDFTFAGAGRWFDTKTKPTPPLESCLSSTALGNVGTAVVRVSK
jgi:hypothetical protein